LRPIGIELEAIPPVKSVLGWDLVLCETHTTKPKFPEKNGEFVTMADFVKEPYLHDDPACGLEEDEPPL